MVSVKPEHHWPHSTGQEVVLLRGVVPLLKGDTGVRIGRIQGPVLTALHEGAMKASATAVCIVCLLRNRPEDGLEVLEFYLVSASEV